MMKRYLLPLAAMTLFAGTLFAETKTETIKIDGMQCKYSCVDKVDKSLAKVEGLESKDVKKGSAKVSYDTEKTSREEIVASIEKAGFKVKQ